MVNIGVLRYKNSQQLLCLKFFLKSKFVLANYDCDNQVYIKKTQNSVNT